MDSLPKSHAQRILKQELKAEGTKADDVWDRETVGYKVRDSAMACQRPPGAARRVPRGRGDT